MLRMPRNGSESGQRGTALIEFALVLPLLILLTFLVVDFSRAFMVKNLLVQAAREGARHAAVHAPTDSVETVVKAVAGVAGLDGNTVSVSTSFVGSNVQVSASAPFTWLYPGVLGLMGVSSTGTDTLSAACTMYLEPSGP